MTSGSRRSARRPPLPRTLPERELKAVEAHLERRERERDRLFERARALRRHAQAAMTRLHDARASAAELDALLAEGRALARSVAGSPDAGLAQDALQEYVEASLLSAVRDGAPFPTPRALGVGPEAYLLGLGDLVGELRRLALSALGEHRVEEAARLAALMEAVYRTLMRFEAPRGIVALKPKQDQARGLLERTRGELALARLLERARLPAGPEPLEEGP